MRQAPVAVVLALTLAAGCMSRKTSGRDLVLVEPDQAAQLIEGHKRLFGLAGTARTAVVDPRSANDYRAGHLPGALSVPFQDVSAEYRRLEDFDFVLVYGSDYDDPRAEAMSKRLLELGIKDVRTLRGGVRAWLAGGYTLETGD